MTDLQQLVDNLGLNDRVKLLGFRTDVHDLLCSSDIAFHAALGEGFSLSIIEYMSSRLPVLVPDIPSVKQAIDDGITGFVYPTNDENATALLLRNLVNEPSSRAEMGLQAKKTADTFYTLDQCTASFNKYIHEYVL